MVWGSYLAIRQLKRSNKWTSALIICVMVLTFLNLTLVSGILVGLVEGLIEAQHRHYTGDIIISPLQEKKYIENTDKISTIVASLPEFEALSARVIVEGSVEANYNERKKYTEKINSANATFSGIDPTAEDRVTDLSSLVIEGDYLKPDVYDQVMIGMQYLRQYQDYEAPGFSPLDNVGIGSKIRIKIGDITREVTVIGIIKSKIDQVDRIIYFPIAQLKSMVGRNDGNANEIAIKLKEGSDIPIVSEKILRGGVNGLAKVQMFQDVQSKFIKDVKATFSILGLLISLISLTVAAITVFIVIFINVITRRKYIGILEGIGVNSGSIKLAYVFQSLFYATSGIVIGGLLLFLVFKPYFALHPIDFPLSDGVLVANPLDTLFKSMLLLVATVVAGYLPARYVARQRILDSILGK